MEDRSGGNRLIPAQRREAVNHVQKTCVVSQRLACQTSGQPLSTQRYHPKLGEDETSLIKRFLELVVEFPRFGDRRITRLLRSEGWGVNAKRVYRLWCQEGLKFRKKSIKRRQLGSSEGGIIRRRAEQKDHVWELDFIFDRTTDERSLMMLVIIDGFNRECIAVEVSRKLSSDDLIGVLVDLLVIRGVPISIRSNNWPENISCRVRAILESIDVGSSYIKPGCPWQNGCVESFNSKLRDEWLNCEELTTVQDARVIIEQWRQTYNHRRPLISLDGLTQAVFATHCGAVTPVAALPAFKRHSEVATITKPIPS